TETPLNIPWFAPPVGWTGSSGNPPKSSRNPGLISRLWSKLEPSTEFRSKGPQPLERRSNQILAHGRNTKPSCCDQPGGRQFGPLENIEVLVNPETGHFVTISVGEPGELTGIRISDETQGCDDCGAHHWNGEDLPLIFRSGKWLCSNCY